MANQEPPVVNPYVGLQPFSRDKKDQTRFFGRDYESDEIISLILGHRLVLIYAQSGAGKTSIINAKIAPELENKYRYQVLPTARIGRYVSNSVTALLTKVNNHYASLEIKNMYMLNALQSLLDEQETDDLTSLFDKELSDFLDYYYPVSEDKTIEEPKSRILVFDQLEELFTFYPNDNWREEQKNFFEQVAKALRNDRSLRIVFVIREDYLAELDPFLELLPERLRPRFRIERLRRDNAFLAIQKPLQSMNTGHYNSFKDIIDKDIDEIIDSFLNIKSADTGEIRKVRGQFVEPILLQLVCERWWRRKVSKLSRGNKNSLSQDSTSTLTSVDEALKELYESTIREASVSTKVKEETIRKWCGKKLITSNGTRALVYLTRNSSQDEIDPRIVDALETNHLIRVVHREASSSNAQWYELAHDRLIGPMKDSNGECDRRVARDLAKRYQKLKIILPVVIVIIVLTTTVAVSTYYLNTVPVHACSAGQTISVEGGSSAVDSNLKTNKTYVASGDSNTLFVIDGNTCTVVKPVKVGENPSAVAVDPNSGLVYVANNDSNAVSIVDGQNNELVSSVNVGRGPTAVAVDPTTSKAYVANSHDNTVSVIDGRTYVVVGKPILVGQYPQAIAIDPNTHKVYVANQINNTVSVIDGLTSTIVGKPISVGRGPSFVVIDPDTHKVYVASRQGKSVSVIDIKTDKIVDTIRVGRGLSGLTVDTKTDKVYVSDSHPNSIYVIDGKNNTVISTSHLNNTAGPIFFNRITNLMYHLSNREVSMINAAALNKERDIIPVGMSPIDVKFDSRTNKLYVVNMGSRHDQPLGIISVIDLKTNKIVSNIKVGMGPDGIAIDPTTNKAYASNFKNNTISVIDLKTNAVIGKPIPVGSAPSGIAIDLNARKVYVPNHDNDTVSVINLNTNKVVATINVGRGPYAVAVNPDTDKVYVANAKGGTLSVINGMTYAVVGKPIPVDNAPEAVAVDTNTSKVYVANYLDDTVSVIDLNTNKVKRVYLDDGNSPDAIAVAAGKAYVANSRTDSVSVINLKTDMVVAKVGIKMGNPKAIAIDPSAGKAYVANYKDDTVSIIKLYGTSASKLKS